MRQPRQRGQQPKSMAERDRVIQAYESAAPELIDRFDSIDPLRLLAPVRDYLPQMPADILDVGAGTGRTAAWFASLGHQVVAVEPVAAFRRAGQARRPAACVEWLDDRLPHLPALAQRAKPFQCILLSAVWHHLSGPDRRSALPRLRRLSARAGRVVLSVRAGPGAPDRPGFAAQIAQTLDWAPGAGFVLRAELSAASVQRQNRQAGVGWTWLVLEAV